LLPEGSVTEAKVTKAQPHLEGKPKGDNSMVVKVRCEPTVRFNRPGS